MRGRRQDAVSRRVDAAVLLYVALSWRRAGMAPTLEEIGLGTGVGAKGSVRWRLDRLRRYGLVEWETGGWRTLRLTRRGWLQAEKMLAKVVTEDE